MSEQFALQQVFLQRAAVDDDDGLVRARAQLVDQAREQFLARAAFPLDQDGRPAGRHAAGHVDELHHLVAFVDDLFGGHAALAQLLPEQFVFPDQAPAFRNAVHQQKQLIELHGLGDVVDGADLDRFDGRFNGAVGGDDDDVDLMVDALHFLEHVHAVHAGHLDVQEHDVDIVLLEPLQALPAVVGRHDRQARGLQLEHQHLHEILFVVHYHHMGRHRDHDRSSPWRLVVAAEAPPGRHRVGEAGQAPPQAVSRGFPRAARHGTPPPGRSGWRP